MITISTDDQREAVLEVIKDKIESTDGKDKINEFWRTAFMLVDLDGGLSDEYKSTIKRLVRIYVREHVKPEYHDAQLLATLLIATSDYLA